MRLTTQRIEQGKKMSSYFEKRQKKLFEQLEKDEAKLKAKLLQIYEREAAKLEKEIASYFSQYGIDNVIEYRTLLQSLSDSDRAMLFERWDDFATKYPEYRDLMPIRTSIYELDRLQGLQYSINLQQLQIGATENELIRKHLEQAALRAANMSGAIMGMGSSFYSVNSDIVKMFVGKDWAGLGDFSSRIWKNKEKLVNYINTDLAQGFARGDNFQKLSRNILDRVQRVSKNDAYRLVYTEGSFVSNEAAMKPFEDNGFDYYSVITMEDKDVCSICRGIKDASKVTPFDIKAKAVGENFPPLHPWCRCTFNISVPNWGEWIDNYVQSGGDPKTAAKVEKNIEANKKEAPLTKKNLDDCKTPEEVADYMREQDWFVHSEINGKEWRSDSGIDFSKIDLESSKSIARMYENTFEEFPNLVGRFSAPSIAELDGSTFAQTFVSTAHPGIQFNSRFYKNFSHIKNVYENSTKVGSSGIFTIPAFHPANTTVDAIGFHEMGHAIDALLSGGLKRSRNFSNSIRPTALRLAGIKVNDIEAAVSTYATENAMEWLAECWAEYKTSPKPRKCAIIVGELIEKELKKL